MSLAGSLSDFDISYIFQIISQEGKSGKLVLTSDESEGYIVFKKGKVISAGTNKQDVQSMLFNYLVNVRKYPKTEITELRALYHENLRHLSNKLLEKGFISLLELTSILETGIEDITCSTFLWNRGNYRFETIPNVDSYQIGSFSLLADSIIMEAARRLDEMKRMREVINRNTVFVRSEGSSEINIRIDPMSALNNFPGYIYTLIDGTSSIGLICQESFFAEYQVYTAIYELLLEKKITPLSDTISLTISAAIKSTKDSKTARMSKIFTSVLATGIFIISIYIIGAIFLREILFSKVIAESDRIRTELKLSRSYQKISIATLQYQGNFGALPLYSTDLINKKILEKRDLKGFISSTNNNF